MSTEVSVVSGATEVSILSGEIKNAGSIKLMPSGDTDDYVTFATVSNVPCIYGTGSYLSIGDAATTSQSLASEDDLLVTGKLEVDGIAYFDSAGPHKVASGFTLEVDGYGNSELLLTGTDVKLRSTANVLFQPAASSYVKITAGLGLLMGDTMAVFTGVAADDYLTLAAYDSTGGTRTGMEAMRIANNTTTPCKIGFYGVTPVVKPLKANFNNWAAATDVAGALAALGLVDAA